MSFEDIRFPCAIEKTNFSSPKSQIKIRNLLSHKNFDKQFFNNYVYGIDISKSYVNLNLKLSQNNVTECSAHVLSIERKKSDNMLHRKRSIIRSPISNDLYFLND